jgi:hypothetical protein
MISGERVSLITRQVILTLARLKQMAPRPRDVVIVPKLRPEIRLCLIDRLCPCRVELNQVRSLGTRLLVLVAELSKLSDRHHFVLGASY